MATPRSSVQQASLWPSLLYHPQSGHLLGSLLSSVVGKLAILRPFAALVLPLWQVPAHLRVGGRGPNLAHLLR
jgi:hypothetical protein